MPKKTSPQVRATAGEKTPGGEDLIQRVTAAAALCVDKLGLDAITVDDIAREAGVSRATLYRRFGSREEILAELLRQQARPYVEQAVSLLAQAENLGRRIELGTVYAVMEMPRNRHLKAMFESGILRSNFALIRSVYRQLAEVTLTPVLEAARATGELRPGLELDEVSDWLLREFVLLVRDGPWDEEVLRSRIRHFILPVLIGDAVVARATAAATEPASVEERLQRLEGRMIELQRMLGLIRSDLREQR